MKRIKMPPSHWGKWSKKLRKMRVGDSILAGDEIEAQTIVRVFFRNKMRGSRRHMGGDRYRVWRIK